MMVMGPRMAIRKLGVVTGFKSFCFSRRTHIISNSGQWVRTFSGPCRHVVTCIIRYQLSGCINGRLYNFLVYM